MTKCIKCQKEVNCSMCSAREQGVFVPQHSCPNAHETQCVQVQSPIKDEQEVTEARKLLKSGGTKYRMMLIVHKPCPRCQTPQIEIDGSRKGLIQDILNKLDSYGCGKHSKLKQYLKDLLSS